MGKYSCIYFRNIVTERTIEELRYKITEGIKVYFFTYDPIDFVKKHEFLNFASENQFLFCYETMYNEQLTEDFNFYNGDVPENVFNVLVKYTPLFNRDQFLIEHAKLNSNITVQAGAGTGKTTVMISRIIYLKHMHKEMSFAEIALITFTNQAALHMREKLVEKIKLYFEITNDLKYLKWLQELKHMEIGTIHSFAHTILKINQEHIFEQIDFSVAQFIFRRRMTIEEVIHHFNEEYPEKFEYFKFIEQYKVIQTIESIIEQINNFSLTLNHIHTLDFGHSEDTSHSFYEFVVKETISRLYQYKKEKEYMGVNDLITELINLIETQENYKFPYKYIFIDEFQDTDRQQTNFFSHITNKYPVKLFVVGDIKQSIYRFRGADYTAFNQLEREANIDYRFYLQLNYRSQYSLLKELNSLFLKWPKYVDSFKFHDEDYLLPGLEMEDSDKNAIENIYFTSTVKLIEFLKENEQSNMAILVRTNNEVNDLSLLCEENKILYFSDRDGDFYRSIAVKEFYQLIRRFTHPSDWKNRYLLNLSSYGEQSVEIDEIINRFSPDRTVATLFNDTDKRLDRYVDQFMYRGAFEILDEIINEINPAKVYAMRFIYNRLQLYKTETFDLEQAKILEQEYRMNLNQLIYLLKNELKHTVPTLNKIQKLLTLKMQTDNQVSQIKLDHKEDKRLTIMTVHKAKGLEFDYVFLPNTDRMFNTFTKTDVYIKDNKVGYRTFIEKGKTFRNDYYLSLKDKEKVENIGEEARLLYVALTRAKKKVFVNAPEHSNNYSIRNWGDLIAKGSIEKSKF